MKLTLIKSKFLILFITSLFFVNLISALPLLVQGKFFKDVFAQDVVPQVTRDEVLNVVNKGNEVIINDKNVNLPWIQWQQGGEIHTGLADFAAEANLGIELLSTTNKDKQPVQWFGYSNILPTQFPNPYRYLDITDLVKNTSLEIDNINPYLALKLPPSRVNKIYEVSENQGKKIIIELNQPSFFQVSQGKDVGIISLDSQADNSLFPSLPSNNNTPVIQEEEGDEIPENINTNNSKLFTISSKENKTLVNINLPAFSNLKVTSANPNILFVDINATAINPRDILWNNDVIYSRKYVGINNNKDQFLVSSLTLNTKSYNLDLRPILTNNNTVIGIAPLKTTAQNSGAMAGINGGFFNRNNQLPLGAIKDRENWLSSPILNRGVIAWNDLGEVKIDRIKLEETITTGRGDRIINNYVNSGYIQAGLARYTENWGFNYTTLSDGEIVAVVENGIIRDKIVGVKAGEDSINIPPKGYLLVFRKFKTGADKFSLNDSVSVNTYTNPTDFASYPYIMGAGPLLLLNGQIVLNGEAENFSKAFNTQKASRSAIAVNSQGKILLVAVHSRIGGAGPTLAEMAQILQRMGAISALNLDGGSSTQIYLGGAIIDRSPATVARVHNGIGVFLRQR